MKRNMNALAQYLAVVGLFIVLALFIPVHGNFVYWLGLIGSLLMFAGIYWAFHLAFRKNRVIKPGTSALNFRTPRNSLEKIILGWPIFRTAYMMAVAQAVVGALLMMTARSCPVMLAVLLEAVIIAATVFLVSLRNESREAVTESENNLRDKTGAMKKMRADARHLADSIEDSEVRAKMEKLADNMKYADPVSNAETKEADDRLANLLKDIAEGRGDSSALLDEASSLLDERNNIAKNSK